MRPEYTQERDLTFSRWVRENCPTPKEGWTAIDIDFVLRDYKHKRLALMEVKTHSASMTFAQEQTYRLLHNCITIGMSQIYPEWSYEGHWLLVFEGKGPQDGGIKLNGIDITETQLLYYISNIIDPRDRGLGAPKTQ